MTPDETSLIESVPALVKKKIPNDPEELVGAFTEALDLSQKLLDRRQKYHDKMFKILEILPALKEYFDFVDLEIREGLTWEEASQRGELRSGFTQAEREREKQFWELMSEKSQFSIALRQLEDHRLKAIRLKALDMGIPLRGDDQPATGFRHSDDYRSVWKDGQKFILTTSQAAVIECLHENYENETPDVGQERLIHASGTSATRLQDIFKGSKDAYRALVVSKRKGTYRLDI